MTEHCFISYSTVDALDFARKLANKLEGGTPNVPVWFDKDDLRPGRDWDLQIDDALKTCKMVLFVMTADSTHEKSVCRQEWSRALSYKKPIIPLWVQNEIDVPFRLQDRQRIDFRKSFDAGLANLRDYLAWLDSPEGVLQSYKDRLLDAERDLQRARDEDKPRIQLDIEELTKQVAVQEKVVANPQAAQAQTQRNIQAGIKREQQPEKPIAAKTSTKFINPPPGIAPNYFQDRVVETKQIFDFLNNGSQRMMTIVGRGGVGKTAMVCRLLKGIESGQLPDGLGEMKADGIIYLSESGSHRVNFANIFYDLCELLPSETAQELDTVYKNPQASTESKMRALLEKFTSVRVVLLLDNFEPLVDTETFAIRDAELDEALRAFLNGAHTDVKVIITTRVAPRTLNLSQPGRQRVLTLDEGLESPYAENILREMDSDGRMGLKLALADQLSRARERTRGYPRALEALFAILVSDRYTSLEELLDKPTPENVVQELVGEAFNRLDINAQRVMQALAVYNRPVTPAAVDYLLAPHIPAIDSAPILQRLANMHFARKESGRFYLHPVDRDFAYDTIPKGEQSFESIEESDFQSEDIEFDEDDILEEEDDEWIDEDNEVGFDDDDSDFDRNELINNLRVSRIDFTRFGLLDRAADYFVKARKPREEWKKLDDIVAQLVEFDLRCAAENYDIAADVLLDVATNYIHLWGHYALEATMYRRVYKYVQSEHHKQDMLWGLGFSISPMGKLSEANIYFEQALEIARRRNDREAENAIINILGTNYQSISNYSKAIESYEKALVIAREIGDKKGEENAIGNIGTVHADLSNIPKAIEFYEQALAIAREINNRLDEGLWLGNLGSAYDYLGQVKKAIEFYEQALEISREHSDRSNVGLWLGNLGGVYDDLGQAEKAMEFYEQALAIAHEIGDRSREGRDLGSLGSAYQNLGEVRKAIEFYDQALTIAREIGNRRGEGNALTSLGSAYQNLGEVRKAIEFYEQALAIDREIDDRSGEGVDLTSLGSAYQNLGEVRKAIEFYEQALVIDRETGNRRSEESALTNLGSAYSDLGEVQKAMELYKEALAVVIQIGSAAAYEYEALAEAYLSIGQLEDALINAKEAQNFDEQQNNHNISTLLGIIALRQREANTARPAFMRAIEQADEILAKTPELYTALDAKGLALCGLAICDDKKYVANAIETFRAARKIAPHAGVVKSVLRLFDELVKCDEEGILKAVRKAVEGKE